MFTSKERQKEAEAVSNASNAIGKGTTIEGSIETGGNIRIEGKVLGDVKSKAKVVLGGSGCVQGNIVAHNADLEGEVRGNLEVSETLTLKSTAVIHGDIATGKLVVESGAVFNGTCKMGGLVRDIKAGESEGQKTGFFLRSESSKGG